MVHQYTALANPFSPAVYKNFLVKKSNKNLFVSFCCVSYCLFVFIMVVSKLVSNFEHYYVLLSLMANEIHSNLILTKRIKLQPFTA